MKKKYFKCRNNTFYTKYTKEEIYSLGIPGDFSSYLPFVEDMDYGPWESEYMKYYDYQIKNDRDPKYAFGKFIAFMRLFVPRQYSFADGDITRKYS